MNTQTLDGAEINCLLFLLIFLLLLEKENWRLPSFLPALHPVFLK